ncbi:MAG: site-specific integrase [Litorimonas sp.]
MLKLTRRPKTPFWIVRGTVGGKPFERSTKTTDRTLAESLRIRWEKELDEQRIYGVKATATFAEAVNLYLDTGKPGRFLLPLLNALGGTLLHEIDFRLVMDTANRLYPKAAPATLQRQAITPIQSIMNRAAKAGLCEPVLFPRMPESPAKLRWLTPEEFDAMLEACNPATTFDVLLMLLLATGGRVSTLLDAPARSYHRGTGQVWLPSVKGGSDSMHNLPPRVASALPRLHWETPFASPIITGRGAPYRRTADGRYQIKDAFARVRDRAGLGRDVTPHTVRHTFATWHYACGNDVRATKDAGGWKTYAMVERYSKLAPADLPHRIEAHGLLWPQFVGKIGENPGTVVTLPRKR